MPTPRPCGPRHRIEPAPRFPWPAHRRFIDWGSTTVDSPWKTLLGKLDRMCEAFGDRVFDVVGEVLSLNKVNLPDMLREVAYEPRRLDDCLDMIDRIDPDLLGRHEEATGIALARGHVDFPAFAQDNLEAEERRLMPRYVESHFLSAAKAVGLRTEARARGLWRIEHVRADLRSERLTPVRRAGAPDASYRKLTFYKEHLE